jgi:cell division septation protein DedD
MSEGNDIPWEIEGGAQGESQGEVQEQDQVKKKRKPNLLRLSLMGILLAVLALGYLSYTGVIKPLGMLNLQRSAGVSKPAKPTVKKRRLDNIINRKARGITERPRVAMPKETAETKDEKPIPLSAFSPTKPVGKDIPTPPPTRISLYPYSLYLGSYRTVERANKAISMYREKGLSPYWVKMDFKKKGIWYRVYAEHFADQNEAERFRQRHGLKEATVKNTQYANLICTYPAETVSLKVRIHSLNNSGYSPYIIKADSGKLRLFVGGYSDKQRAVTLQNELKSKGITSQVVKR